MDLFNIIIQNIFSPAILFFLLGICSGFLKSDLKVPNSISAYLSIYLMMAIGFKGGVAISDTAEMDGTVIEVIVSGLVIGFLLPFIGYYLLRLTTKLDSPTAAAVSAQYGSISIVTFVTATDFLKSEEVLYAGFIVGVLALKEAPAILSGLYIAHSAAPETDCHPQAKKKLAREIFTNGAILLLLGSFMIGWITGNPGLQKVEGFFSVPFQGVLCLFLLDMGLLVSKNIPHLRKFTISLALFGLYMPLIGGSVGLLTSYLIGLDVGTGTLFTVLCASASYIAVPAAMRLALPEANPGIYVPISLAITFPFNVGLGIPLYYALAKMIL